MTNIHVVIGAMWGDEGKGLMTDYLASQHPDAINIKFNGGSQCGHTVTTPDGLQHVFSHFGSGSFVGIPTYLSEFFVCDPLTYAKETLELDALGVHPNVFVHPDCYVTTPFDMIINNLLECRRGDAKHGSCGVGFGETIARNENFEKLTVRDLMSPDLLDKITKIRDEYIATRFDPPLDVNDPMEQKWLFIINNADLMAKWVRTSREFIDSVTVTSTLAPYNTMIFEGSQGLMLDQNSSNFPHVTRSNTGIDNVLSLLDRMAVDVDQFDVYYISRAYTNKHGAGPLRHEQELSNNVIDETNKTNDAQGTMRFAPLLLDDLSDVTLADFSKCLDVYVHTQVRIVFTCLDQLEGECLFVAQNSLKSCSHEAFINMLTELSSYVSYGPTRDDIINTIEGG